MLEQVKVFQYFMEDEEFDEERCERFARFLSNITVCEFHKFTKTECFNAFIHIALCCLDDGPIDANYAMETFNHSHMLRFFSREEIDNIYHTLKATGLPN